MNWIVDINEKTVSDKNTPLPVLPGRPNTLTVRPAGSAPEAAFTAHLEVTAPDGRIRIETAALPAASLDLGPFTAPACYDFENGVVYRRGYRLHLTIENARSGSRAQEWRFSQGLTRDSDAEWFFLDGPERAVYNDGHIPEGETVWHPLSYSGKPMDPPIAFRLNPAVLCDPDRAVAMVYLRPSVPGPIRATLTVKDAAEGNPLFKTEIDITDEWKEISLPATEWPEGTFTLELSPQIAGKPYEGPILTYRRKLPDSLSISPLSPFTLETDPSREPIAISDPPRNGAIRPNASGWYALFALADGPCGLKVGNEPWIRRLDAPALPELGDVFVAALDLTGCDLTVLHDSVTDKGLRFLRLAPVTAESVRKFRDQAENPPVQLRGVDDWWCCLPRHLSDPESLDEGEFDRILQGQREVGFTSLAWAIGRSWVQYHSNLPDTCYFPCTDLTPEHIEEYPWHATWGHMVRDLDAWGHPLARRSVHDLKLYGWLAMNRHYGPESYGGAFHSPWRKAHPELSHQSKESGVEDPSRVEYFFEETRRERLAILEEAAGYGPDGIVLGCCRQPPMSGYNVEMVEAYIRETGDDPRDLDIHDGERFKKWLQWRADRLTTLLRDLRKRLEPIQEKLGRLIPIAARVPDEGLDWCLAEGMDVKTWVREGLIDELMLDPLDDGGAQVNHDLTPYITLCREHGVTVYGGINATTGALCRDHRCLHGQYSPVVGLRRALGILKAGVSGIEIYEAETLSTCTHERWLVPLWGNPALCEQVLNQSNLEAVFPIVASNAALGHDNHSYLYCYSLIGKRGQPLPRGVKNLL